MHELSLTPEFVFENSSPDVIGCRGNRFGRSKFVDLSGDVSLTTVKIYLRILVTVYGGGGDAVPLILLIYIHQVNSELTLY